MIYIDVFHFVIQSCRVTQILRLILLRLKIKMKEKPFSMSDGRPGEGDALGKNVKQGCSVQIAQNIPFSTADIMQNYNPYLRKVLKNDNTFSEKFPRNSP